MVNDLWCIVYEGSYMPLNRIRVIYKQRDANLAIFETVNGDSFVVFGYLWCHYKSYMVNGVDGRRRLILGGPAPVSNRSNQFCCGTKILCRSSNFFSHAIHLARNAMCYIFFPKNEHGLRFILICFTDMFYNLVPEMDYFK